MPACVSPGYPSTARSYQRATDRDRISIGVLARVVPRDLVDEVIMETGRLEHRRRLPPARVVVLTGSTIAVNLLLVDDWVNLPTDDDIHASACSILGLQDCSYCLSVPRSAPIWERTRRSCAAFSTSATRRISEMKSCAYLPKPADLSFASSSSDCRKLA